MDRGNPHKKTNLHKTKSLGSKRVELREDGKLTTGISKLGFGTTILRGPQRISFVLLPQQSNKTYPPYLKLSLSRNAIAGNLFCMPCQGTSCGGVKAGTGGPRLSGAASVADDGVA
jgi:hypothetical protein